MVPTTSSLRAWRDLGSEIRTKCDYTVSTTLCKSQDAKFPSSGKTHRGLPGRTPQSPWKIFAVRVFMNTWRVGLAASISLILEAKFGSYLQKRKIWVILVMPTSSPWGDVHDGAQAVSPATQASAPRSCSKGPPMALNLLTAKDILIHYWTVKMGSGTSPQISQLHITSSFISILQAESKSDPSSVFFSKHCTDHKCMCFLP